MKNKIISKVRKNYVILPTLDCNLRCVYCYQRDKKKEYMTPATADRVIRFILRDEPGREKKVQLFGGEPTLAWEIVERFARQLFGKTALSITSNGVLLTEERMKFLKDYGFGLALSLDGPPGVTRKTRPGSEAVDIDLVARHFPNAQIIMTLSPENIMDAYPATLWFFEKGFHAIAHNTPTENPWPKTAVRQHDEAFEKLADFYIRISNSGGQPPGFMFLGFARNAVANSGGKKFRNICGSNPNLLGIAPNGDIYPCQDMVMCDAEKRYRIGNVEGGYLPPRAIPLSAMKFPDREKCKLCWFYHQCVGGCGPKNLVACGDRFQPLMNGCELFAKQTQEGIRALLNAGALDLRRPKSAAKKGKK